MQDMIQVLAKNAFAAQQGILAELGGVNRFLGLEFAHERWQIHFNSEGLTLNDKMRAETALMSELKNQAPNERFSVYFRGQKAGASKAYVPKQAAAPSKNLKPIVGVRRIIAIASGKGGVGKSTVSCNLAVALAQKGYRVGLLDADVYGPSATLMLGIDTMPAMDAKGRLLPCEKYGVKVMSFGFFSDRQNPVMWRGPMVGKSIVQFCYDVQWGELDYLLIDSPPGTGDVQLTIVENLPLSGVVIVSTPQDVALIDAHKAVSMFERHDIRILGLVENMSMYVCPHCGNEDDIFGTKAESLIEGRKVSLLAKIPLKRQVRSASDKGEPVALVEEGKVFLELADAINALQL